MEAASDERVELANVFVVHESVRVGVPWLLEASPCGFLRGCETWVVWKTSCQILWMDEIHFAPPKKPRNDDSPPMVSICGSILSSQCKWARGLSSGL